MEVFCPWRANSLSLRSVISHDCLFLCQHPQIPSVTLTSSYLSEAFKQGNIYDFVNVSDKVHSCWKVLNKRYYIELRLLNIHIYECGDSPCFVNIKTFVKRMDYFTIVNLSTLCECYHVCVSGFAFPEVYSVLTSYPKWPKTTSFTFGLLLQQMFYFYMCTIIYWCTSIHWCWFAKELDFSDCIPWTTVHLLALDGHTFWVEGCRGVVRWMDGWNEGWVGGWWMDEWIIKWLEEKLSFLVKG